MRSYLALVCLVALAPYAWVCAVNYYVDPFQYFRKAVRYEPRMYAETRFMNVGFAKYYSYDSIVLGTSMTQNFRPSQMDAVMGGHFIKLSMAGSTPYEEARLLAVAFRSKGESIKAVVWGLDQASWTRPADEREPEEIFPDYLYSPASLQILTRYLASKDVYYTSRIALGLPPDPAARIDFDKLGYWNGKYPFGCKYVRNSYSVIAARPDPKAGESIEALTGNVDANFAAYLVPLAKAHPHTVFYLFIPPYSAAEGLYRAQHAPVELSARESLRQRLSQLAASLPNVHLYDFQSMRAITDDLANYQDIYHYSAAINDWMIVYMHSHAGLLVDAGYADYAKALRYDHVFKACLPGTGEK